MLVLTKNGEIIEQDRYVLESISSRGNGRYGLELNTYALSGVKVNYPKEIKSECAAALFHNSPDEFEIRGEAVIPKNDRSYNKYGKNVVWRNIAAGIFNRQVPFNLKGVLEYISNNSCDNEGKYYSIKDEDFMIFNPEFEGRRCNTPEIYNNARLIASLFLNSDNEVVSFKRGDILTINLNNYEVTIKRSDGSVEKFIDDGEELDIVVYSISHNGSNIDINNEMFLNNNNNTCNNVNNKFSKLGFKTINEIDFENNVKNELLENGYSKTFTITSNRDEIIDKVYEFYGISKENNKRESDLARLRNSYEYATDGVVIKPINSDKITQNVDLRLGRNGKIVLSEYPEDQIAIKLLSEIVRVKLDHIEYNETKLGNITCTGVLDKAYRTESGAMVSNVNLHNIEWLKANDWIKEGKEYDLCMSLDIIPVLMNPNL